MRRPTQAAAYHGGRPHDLVISPGDTVISPTKRTTHRMPARSPRHLPRVIAGVAAALVLLATVAGAGVRAFQGRLQDNITAVDVTEQLGGSPTQEPLVVDETGDLQPVNILLMGSDTRSGKGNGGFGSAEKIGGERSDTTILLHVSADRKTALAMSIPRDTLITLPRCKVKGKTVGGYQGRFNEAFDLGGPGCTLKAVNEMTGIDVTNFMVIDFGGFKRVTEAIGGVEICLAQPVNDSRSGLNLSKGKHTVSGEEALAFVRVRHGIGDGSDTSRIRRQQAFLSAMARQVLSSGTLLNPTKLIGVLDAATRSLKADPQLANIDNLQQLVLSMKDVRPNDITFVTLPWYPSGDGATILMNKKKAKPILEAIKNDTPWPPKQADQPILKVEPASIYVNVFNGTTEKGKAKKVAKQLRKLGYRVMDVGSAESPQAVTTVEYDPKWDISARTLIAAADAEGKAVKKQGQRMTLIIGDDFTAIEDVKIDALANDKTANVNTADESFCAN